MPTLFNQNAKKALRDNNLQSALNFFDTGFKSARAEAIEELGEFEHHRRRAAQIRKRAVSNLPVLLEQFEENAIREGAKVHWCETGVDANKTIEAICSNVNAKRIVKGKSMASEEIHLNRHLLDAGYDVIESDLGEYIVQLSNETPSHIVAPAIHKRFQDVSKLFKENHQYDTQPRRETSADLVSEARGALRDVFRSADVGITGANFLVAESGTSVIVTNEGNGDLTQTHPRVHIVIVGIEKVVSSFDDVFGLLRVLARSSTGQDITNYVTFSTGPKREADLDGPEEMHIVLLDNGRSELLGSPAEDVLRCIRCAACLNHCPVYRSVGGHAYGTIYPGPIGAAISPQLDTSNTAKEIPSATPMCGRCNEVCPVGIPLTKIFRYWRTEKSRAQSVFQVERLSLFLWSLIAAHPGFYRPFNWAARNVLRLMGRKNGRVKKLPFVGGWTDYRDMPAPTKGDSS